MAQFSMNNLPINPFTNKPIPMGVNSRAVVGGRSLLDNVYGASNNPSIQANPPSRFRTDMMSGYKTSPNSSFGVRRNPTRSSGAFVDPNINDPLLRNFPEQREDINKIYSKIPKDQRKYVKVQDGQVFFEYPEELEMGTQDQTEKVPSNIPQFNTEEEYLKASGLLNQQGNKTNNKGLLNTSKEEVNEQKPKMTMQGLLDKAVQFATSDFGRDFFMNIDDDYSLKPKSFLSRISDGYNVAKANEVQREKLDIEKTKANQLDPRGQPVYRYMIRDPKGNNYNVFSHRGEMYANINGKRVLQKDWEKELGGTVDVRTAGQQTFGISNVDKFGDIESDLLSQEQSLRSYSRYLNLQENTNTGVRRLADTYSGVFKTFFGEGLTQEELNTKIANGELQRLIGASRKEIVGGGVMTEQDALRIINALGGNVDALQDPQQVKKAISQMFREKYESYELNLRKYNYNVQNEYGTKGYKIKEPVKFTKTQLSVFDPNITTDLGLISYDDLSDTELLQINEGNLSPENVRLLFKEMQDRGIL